MELPDDSSIIILDSSLRDLEGLELRLAKDFDGYRRTMATLALVAQQRVAGSDLAYNQHFHRALLADSYLAQEHLAKAVSHANFAHQAALALKRSLS
ncbi:hypothetical protein [Mailhella sp.]